MLKWLSGLCFSAAVFVGVAQAEPIVWNFTGGVVTCPSTPEIEALVPCNGSLHGYIRFDNAATPSSPGNWNLPGAVFHAEIGDLVLDGTGAIAWLWPNLDALLFEGNATSPTFPGLYSTWRIYSITYTDGYFDPEQLPANPAHSDPETEFWVDQILTVQLSVPREDYYVHDQIGTDTQFGLTRAIPEPPPVAIYFGLGVILISMRLLRASRAWAR